MYSLHKNVKIAGLPKRLRYQLGLLKFSQPRVEVTPNYVFTHFIVSFSLPAYKSFHFHETTTIM